MPTDHDATTPLVEAVSRVLNEQGVNDYNGFTFHPEIAEAVIAAIRAHLVAQAGASVVTHGGDDEGHNDHGTTRWQESLREWLEGAMR